MGSTSMRSDTKYPLMPGTAVSRRGSTPGAGTMPVLPASRTRMATAGCCRNAVTAIRKALSKLPLGGRFWPRGGVPTRIFLDAAGDDSERAVRKRPLQLECFVRRSRHPQRCWDNTIKPQMGSTLKGRQNDMMRWRYGLAIRGAPSAQDQG